MSELHRCCANGDSQSVQELIANGTEGGLINLNEKDKFGETPLHIVSRHGKLEIVKELLQHNANINEKNDIGETPLHIVSRNGKLEIVKELLQHNANFNETNNYGWTPLHLASLNSKLEIVKELLMYSDRSIKNNIGKTASQVAKTQEIKNLIENYQDLLEIKEPEIENL